MAADGDVALSLYCYTDPYCTWCWGSEPMLTKLRALYGDKLKFVYKMGGLVRDIRQFHDPANGIGGSHWYKQVSAHWDEASQRHGMPVDSKVWYDVKDDFRSTYPSCLAFKAVELMAPSMAGRYLRRLREAVSAERRPIHDLAVTAALAEELGLDGTGFRRRIESGEAEAAFAADLEECQSMMIRSFPTFLFRNPQGRQIMIGAYRSFPTFADVVRELTAGQLGPGRTLTLQDDLMGVVELNGSATVREIAEVFNLSPADAEDALDALALRGGVDKTAAGNGFLYRVASPPACSPDRPLLC